MRLLIALLSFSALAPVAWAQDDLAARAALAERYVEATVRDGLAKSLDGLLEEELRSTEMPEEQETWMQAHVPTILGRHLEPLIDAMEQAYAEGLTEQELPALVEFYETPEGRALALKQFDIESRQGQQFLTFMNSYLTELMGKFCAEFDCAIPDAAGPDAKTRRPS